MCVGIIPPPPLLISSPISLTNLSTFDVEFARLQHYEVDLPCQILPWPQKQCHLNQNERIPGHRDFQDTDL